MENQQPDALRLADALISPHAGPWDNLEAAAELRRLHRVNDQLLEALEFIPASGSMLGAQAEAKRIAAIAAAKEGA